MSVVVHVGQCGNQLGEAFWRLACGAHDAPNASHSSANPRKKKAISERPQRSVQPSKGEGMPTLYSNQFFHRRSRRARCILVDTEPKVIRAMLRGQDGGAGGLFEPAHVHYEQSGRGNNWAMGYNLQTNARNTLPTKNDLDSVTGVMKSSKRTAHLSSIAPGGCVKPELVELVMDSLRQEVEALDVFRGTMMMHSVGGGTGAGLGCRLLETIRDVYPRSYIGAVSVAPSCAGGDTPLQNYNALLTLQHLQEHTDCIIYKENDELLRSALYWKTLAARGIDASSASHTDEKTVSLREMNALAAADVAGLTFPLVYYPESRGENPLRDIVARPFDMSELVYDCCPLPAAKFLDIRTGVRRDLRSATKKTTNSEHNPMFQAVPSAHGEELETDDFIRLVRQTVKSFPRQSNSTRVIASSANVHGVSESHNSMLTGDTLRTSLPDHHLGNHTNVKFSSFKPFQHVGGGPCVSLALNSGHATASIGHFLHRGRRQFDVKAYVHWYKQYGLEDADFEHAFENCTRIVSNYEELLHS